MTRTEVDRLGARLRVVVTEADLTQLDTFRRSFRASYAKVVDRIRHELAMEVSGRPAKSTTAIVDKLRRSSMRLSQMQDIAGCRILVPNVTEQDRVVGQLQSMFSASVHDRRTQSSSGGATCAGSALDNRCAI